MRRSLAAALGLAVLAAAGPVRAQIVPIARCNAALPCSIPFGLRPATTSDSTNTFAKTGQGNTAAGVRLGIEEGLKPRLDVPPRSQDASETAARIFVKKNPAPIPTPTPTPAPR